jgi:EAL domain-containing protein (putative c-di-GMP-specific phosphodiesterase class I)/CRP-like cAMP-binding protein
MPKTELDKPAKFDEMALFTKRKKFKAGDIIFNEGDIRENAYIIESGRVEIVRQSANTENTRVAELGASDIFGEMALIEPGLRAASARAIEDTFAFIISPNVLENRMQGLDPIVTLLISLLVERYRFSRIEKGEAKAEEEIYGRVPSLVTKAFHEPKGLGEFRERKADALKELALEQEIRRALHQGDFKPYLQPIVSLNDGCIIGYETLIRWHHKTRGIIMPDDFIPVAERTNVIQAIDRSMLEMACDIIPKVHQAVASPVKPFISVNFDDESLVNGISDVINSSGVDPSNIKLEITESAFIGNADTAAKILEGLKDLGVTIALDDFGVGYSSLGYLHRFAIDDIKIDRSFTQRARENKKGLDIVQAIVGLAKTFDLGVIAEGIETSEDSEAMRQIGCSEGQGFLYGKPMSVDEVLAAIG